jgi:hypothetical protein
MAAELAAKYTLSMGELQLNSASDQASYIQGAIDELASGGDGVIKFPKLRGQFYRISGLTLKTGVYLVGDQFPEIRSTNDEGETLIESEGFQDLTGTNGDGGVSDCGVIGLYLNGNRPFWSVTPIATKGHGIAIYGRDFYIDMVKMFRIYRAGLWTE